MRKPARLVALEELETELFRSQLADVEETLSTIDDDAALACNQVGVDLRAFVDRDRNWFINPCVTALDEDDYSHDNEGCLSFPGLTVNKRRHYLISMRWFDERGKEHVEEATGFRSRVWQHECDHLDGVLFIDHLSDNEKRRIAMKMAKRGNGNVR